MHTRILVVVLVLMLAPLAGQSYVVEWDPPFPTETDSIVVTFFADRGTGGLTGYTGDVYAHTGVITDKSTHETDWKYVVAGWFENIPKALMTWVATDVYEIVIDNPRLYYGVVAADTIKSLAFVFRSSDSSLEGKATGGSDIFVPLTRRVVNARFLVPSGDGYFMELGDSVEVLAISQSTQASIDSMTLFANGLPLAGAAGDTLRFTFFPNTPGLTELKIIASDSLGNVDSAAVTVMVNPAIELATRPAGTVDGINYNSVTSATLSLFAPDKKFVYLIGDFNNWQPEMAYFMKKDESDPYGDHFWLILDNLSPGTEYAFQYLVDGEIRIADPYADKILDPWNDGYISSDTYPNLITYPGGKTEWPVAVLQTAQSEYVWQHSDTFVKPEKSGLVIYEMLLRDFLAAHDFATLLDTLDYFERLGVSAIELMPFNEFEGNSSWGYNPSFYFAPDKYYGPKHLLKEFIDAAHERGIAVIMDMVLNHSYGLSPLVRLYWEGDGPAANNPWYNQTSPNPVYSWGYDFNHLSPHTQAFVDRVNKYWLTEYKVDGFRFDFTKGFTQTAGDGGAYDASRINILKRMADEIWETNSSAYVILEHFADNSEETILADYGMLLWGNTNHNYNEATMGYNASSKSDFSWGYYGRRGWSQPHLVTYMESHDEERLMYKNLQYGNVSGDYSTKDLPTALNRMKLAGAFFFTLPGPKMIWQFQELGYDYSIDYGGRLGEKPIRWDYLDDPNRLNLFKTYAALMHLRNANEVFRSGATEATYDLNESTGLKWIWLSHVSMRSTIIGNFGVITRSINPQFQATGIWYDYFTGDSIIVTDVNETLLLGPGQFRIFTDERIAPPEPGILAVPEGDPVTIPTELALHQNYPNPFNPVTAISYALPTAGRVTLTIYDLTGREVARLLDGYQTAGSYRLNWNGRTGAGRDAASGVYIYRLTTNAGQISRKMVLLK